MASPWGNKELIAQFAINFLAILVLLSNMFMSFLSKWTYNGKTDWMMSVAVPLTAFWFLITVVFQQVVVGTGESGFRIQPWFYFALFQAVVGMLFDLQMIILLPRLLIQELQKMGEVSIVKGLKIFAIASWFVLALLEGTYVGFNSYLSYVTKYRLFESIGIFQAASKIGFAYSLAYVAYGLALFGFTSKLRTSVHSRMACLVTLFIILPSFLVLRTFICAYFGLILFSAPQPGQMLAFNILAVVSGTVVLCGISYIGFAGFPTRRRRLDISKPQPSSPPASLQKEKNGPA